MAKDEEFFLAHDKSYINKMKDMMNTVQPGKKFVDDDTGYVKNSLKAIQSSVGTVLDGNFSSFFGVSLVFSCRYGIVLKSWGCVLCNPTSGTSCWNQGQD
jgi:acetoin utilization deacetylase AcuC-like enzyme